MWVSPQGRYAYLASGAGEISCLEVTQVLAEGRSRFQEYAILDTTPYGRILVLDRVIQSASYDEWMYHETFVTSPMCAHRAPRRVAVLGGGEGAMIREVLRHPSVESVVMVDIDEEVVSCCREHLAEFHQGAFDDPRVSLVFADARSWLEAQDHPEFDVVLVDLTEPLSGGPSVRLFTKEFYELVRRSLSGEGVMALQAGSIRPGFSWGYACVLHTLEAVFPSVIPQGCWVTSFAEAWGFIIAGEEGLASLAGNLIDQRLAERGITPQYLDGVTFDSLRCLPRYVRQELAASQVVATDANPIRFRRT